jgi:hypothetical protein
LYTSEKGDSSFKLNVFMRHATNPEMQQVWFKLILSCPKLLQFKHYKIFVQIKRFIN